MTTSNAMGKIVQTIGAVVDVEFPRDQMPNIYDALKMDGTEIGRASCRERVCLAV